MEYPVKRYEDDFMVLTTTFTPKSDCVTSYWYGNEVPSPNLFQGWDDFDANCRPRSTKDARGFAAPATCPVGFWTATTLSENTSPGPVVPTTICCYSYDTPMHCCNLQEIKD
jgi:hypothetical protein